MPTLKMTDAAVQRIGAAAGERTDYFDAHPRDRQRGLVLRVSAGAEGHVTRTWAALYRIKGSTRLRRATIGDYPTYSLAEAREEAAQIVQAARKGKDIVAEREAAARVLAAKEKDTLEAAVKGFLEDWEQRPKRKGGMRAPSYVKTLRQHFDNRVLPRWRGRQISDIKRSDVDELVREVAREAPVLANRVLAAVKALFNWCIRHDPPLVQMNPAALVEKPGLEEERERVLATDELRFVWPAFEGLGYPFGPFFKLALLTGQRLGEVSGMRWSEIDEEAAVWTIPAARTKGRRVHAVPLSAQSLDVIEELKSTRRENIDLLFTTTGKTPISGFSRAKTLLDKAITEARKKKEQSPLPRWTIHDLRRTAATEMSRLKVSRFIVARVLNHADSEVTGIYDRNEFFDEKKAALAQWASYLMGIVTSKVTPIASRRRAARGTS
jgi:integrase